jgi:hypothetical protein
VVTALVANTPAAFGSLLVHYQFESTTGTAPAETTADSSGNLNDGTLGGGLVPGTDYPVITAGNGPDGSNTMQFFGGSGAALASRVFIADGDPDFDTSFTELSFAAWMKPSEESTVDRFFAGKMGNSNNRGWQLYRQGTADPVTTLKDSLVFDYFETQANTPVQGDLTVTDVFDVGVWTHVAVVFKASEFVKIYVNGEIKLNQTTDVLATLNGSNSVAQQFGNRGNNLTAWLGWMDDVRLYNNALTDADVLALATVTPPHAGDFDLDGDVDGADFVAWQTNFPTATGATRAQGDADGDGDVDGADFVVWQTNFPFTPGPGASPVPEPYSILLLGIASLLLLAARQKRVC